MAVLLRDTFCWEKAEFTRLPSSSSSSEWTPFPLTSAIAKANDCIFHKNRLYFIEPFGNILAFDKDDIANYSPSTDLLPAGTWSCDLSLMSCDFICSKLFVESPNGNDIFLLFRCTRLTAGLPKGALRWWVYKLDDDGEDWEPIKSIGDTAFFVGQCGAMSLPVRCDGSSVLEPNSVYFTDKLYPSLPPKTSLFDTGIYNVEDGTVEFLPITDCGTISDYSPPVWLPPAAC